METYDPHKSTNQVRQGSGRMMDTRVLIISMGAVIVLFGIVYLVFMRQTPPGV